MEIDRNSINGIIIKALLTETIDFVLWNRIPNEPICDSLLKTIEEDLIIHMSSIKSHIVIFSENIRKQTEIVITEDMINFSIFLSRQHGSYQTPYVKVDLSLIIDYILSIQIERIATKHDIQSNIIKPTELITKFV